MKYLNPMDGARYLLEIPPKETAPQVRTLARKIINACKAQELDHRRDSASSVYKATVKKKDLEMWYFGRYLEIEAVNGRERQHWRRTR